MEIWLVFTTMKISDMVVGSNIQVLANGIEELYV